MRIDATQPKAALPEMPKMKIENGLETAFLSEMLKYAGPQPAQGEFSGGIGESQFRSMLIDAYAEALSAKLDLGLTNKTGGKT